MSKFVSAFNGQTGAFEIHAVGCRDLKQPRKLRDYNYPPKAHEAASPEALLNSELGDDFSGGCEAGAACTSEQHEHPARYGFPCGSMGAAGFGFSSRVFPCCKAS